MNLLLPQIERNEIHQLVANLGIPFGCERSVRITEQRVFDHRFLLSIAKSQLEEDADERVLEICRRLRMPAAPFQKAADMVRVARFIHFGYEDGISPMCKIYFEVGLRADPTIDPTDMPPILQHVACKWDLSDPARHTITNYLSYPELTWDAVHDRIAHLLSKSSDLLVPVQNILSKAQRRVSDEFSLPYLHVVENNNDRGSFAMTLYDADLSVSCVTTEVRSIAERFSIPDRQISDALRDIEDQSLGNIAAGVHRDGRSFFTVYFGATEC